MKTKYHIEITRKALSGFFSERALKEIVNANIHQDNLTNQLGHDYIHFDSNAFQAGFKYLSNQKKAVIDGINKNDFSSARQALGRGAHSWQDFYSHSNYVELWLAKAGNSPPEEIVINDGDIIHHPDLRSGINYGLIEFIALTPVLSNWIKPHMPDDSHAKMNLDGPEAGKKFQYVYSAALKQTKDLFTNLLLEINELGIPQEKISTFQAFQERRKV
jgi:hypothetical protein